MVDNDQKEFDGICSLASISRGSKFETVGANNPRDSQLSFVHAIQTDRMLCGDGWSSCQVFLSFIFLHLVHLLPNLLGLQIYLSRACSSSSSLVIRVVNIVYEYRSSQRKFSCRTFVKITKLERRDGELLRTD